jgi:hypothetical protein
MHRDLQTLRECSPVPGLDEVCDCIARMLAFAEGQAHAIPQEVAALMTMAIHLLGMLVRGGPGAGKAVEGFRREVHDALDELGAPPSRHAASLGAAALARRSEVAQRSAAKWSSDLAMAATTAFLAHLEAEGAQRGGLHAAWRLLADTAPHRPVATATLDVLLFRAVSCPIEVAVSSDWQVSPAAPAPAPPPEIDLLGACFGRPHAAAEWPQPPLVLTLRRGARALRVVAANTPAPAVAQRVCPTPDAHPLEVVVVEGVETVLVRPERFVLDPSLA